MGNLIWHEYSRYVSITASIYAVWSGFFGLFYRKFFWDFVGGIMRDPGGYQSPPASSIFVTLIIRVPVIPIFAMLCGLFLLALEYPVPQLKALAIYRSLVLRAILLVLQAFLTVLYYQVRAFEPPTLASDMNTPHFFIF
ncbi:hypothetical protein AX16_005203 [Volvariella volvacea WC 439]|nr:hypothetical protein AX16_005203 [Volvariella volvacea WC 439]